MARVQLIIPDEDRAQFLSQARKEGMTFSAWMRAAAHQRVEEMRKSARLHSVEDLRDFFRRIDARYGPDAEPEPDWEEVKRTMLEDQLRDALRS